MIRLSTKIAVAAAGAFALAGCALLSSPDPVQTYRFGGPAAASAAAEGQTTLRQVSLRRVEFPEAVEGDRILGVTGTETAYIGGARWVSPASDLYMESLENAFSAQATRVRLIGPRELSRGELSLNIDMRAFEARYDAPGATPMVVVTARVRLLAMPERTVTAERTFTVQQPAAENRVSAIVEAFDVATRDLNTQIVGWTDANAG
ncbi:MAG: membrane integrity-associated transporter subunit PqiC [Alphaproteobacteria bacterium]|nr:membrane integrity-associated transporter subunit PqiC [Alphaproteobacteria bacterium]MBU2270470.1 membrane integrity-associated transporter subunit PqiC [Alphaproteobacteria bacterium]MBU2419300.1 membrane integrity-associated transporter subunit PqiC [Alphaproteobacteria bacterium]